jgi:hypothetical protein
MFFAKFFLTTNSFKFFPTVTVLIGTNFAVSGFWGIRMWDFRMRILGETGDRASVESLFVVTFPTFDFVDSLKVNETGRNTGQAIPSPAKCDGKSFADKEFTYKSRQMDKVDSFNFLNFMLLVKLSVYLHSCKRGFKVIILDSDHIIL